MTRVLAVLLPVAILTVACLCAVKLFDDRELFVSPPDAMAEGFTREVMTKRWARAREYLVTPMPDAQLAELQSQLEEGANVDAETLAQDKERAQVEVRVKERTLRVAMVWDEGWKVATLPKVMPH